MSRRIDIELTSTRDDGSWTWRAAGAREPRGSLSGDLLPAGASVGDVLKVEVEGYLDGVEVVAVVPARTPRREAERIELIAPTRRDEELVTTRLAGRRSGDRERGRGRDRDQHGRGRDGEGRSRGERRDGRDRDRDRRDGRDRDRRDRRERADQGARPERHERTAPAAVEAKPKPKRLRPGRAHRAELLEAVPAEQRPILEQLLQGGIPAVRQAIDKQNEGLRAEGRPEVKRDALLKVAEDLRPRAAAALWRDRAEAAVANVDELDLRDLRSVVNAAGDAGRDEEARALATQLREALANRVEKEQSAWLAELADMLREGRTVRALRLSSRPPKAGAIIPADLSNQLVEQAGAALTEDTGQERWATVLDALAYSPIRRRVIPASLPHKLSPQLRETVARLGSRLPEIAHIFAIEPDESAGRTERPQRRRSGAGSGPGRSGAGRTGGGQGGGSGRAERGDRPGRGGRKGGRGPKPEGTGDSPEAKSAPAKAPAEDAAPQGEAPVEAAVPAPEASAEETVPQGEAVAEAAVPAPEVPAEEAVEAAVPAPEASAADAAPQGEAPAEDAAPQGEAPGQDAGSAPEPQAPAEPEPEPVVRATESDAGAPVIEVGTPPAGDEGTTGDEPAANPA
jgi:hypothetical protein